MGGTIAAGGGSAVMQVPPALAGASGGGSSPIQAPVQGGGPVAGSDLAAAIAALQGAVGQLASAVQAMQGAGSVTAGGASPVQQSGCGCGGAPAQAPPSGDPGQGANAAPTAAPAQRGNRAGGNGGTSRGDDPPPAPSGSVRDRIVQIARQEFAKNVTEDAGDNKDTAGRIREYRTAVTGPGENPDLAESWCADFASWVWKQAGVPFGRNGQGEDWTVAMIDWARKQGTYHARGSYEPKPGDFVMVDWEGGQDVDHVAVVTEVSGGKVHYIAGNESDRVKQDSFPIGDRRMMGYITPQGG